MTLSVDTSQVKAQLSEFIGRVAFGHERVLVLRRGKPVAALVSVEDLRRLEVADATADETRESPMMHPIMRAFGGWAESDDLGDEFVAEIYADRLKASEREIDL
jgi:prevent-host-death family protein